MTPTELFAQAAKDCPATRAFFEKAIGRVERRPAEGTAREALDAAYLLIAEAAEHEADPPIRSMLKSLLAELSAKSMVAALREQELLAEEGVP